MNTTEVRELNVAELDRVSGAADPNWHYCASGPAGEGVYPNYVGCGMTWGDLVKQMVDAAYGAAEAAGCRPQRPPA
jgi:hypothetical protein